MSVNHRLRTWLPTGGTLPEEVWRARHRGILLLLGLHVPALLVFALLKGESLPHSVVEASAVAFPAMAAVLAHRNRRVSTVFASLGLVTASAVLVHLSGGTIEAHFHFFIMVGVVVLYQDWWPFLVAIAFVTLHHGIAGALAPPRGLQPSGRHRTPLEVGDHPRPRHPRHERCRHCQLAAQRIAAAGNH